jgi:site-specific DNA recombinase
MKEKMDGLEGRKKELETLLTGAEDPPPHLHPKMANFSRIQVAELYDVLQEEAKAKRLKASEVLQSLVKEMILTPEDGELQIDVRGDLARIPGIFPSKRKNPPEGRVFRNLRWLRGHALIRTCAVRKLKRLREGATI